MYRFIKIQKGTIKLKVEEKIRNTKKQLMKEFQEIEK